MQVVWKGVVKLGCGGGRVSLLSQDDPVYFPITNPPPSDLLTAADEEIGAWSCEQDRWEREVSEALRQQQQPWDTETASCSFCSRFLSNVGCSGKTFLNMKAGTEQKMESLLLYFKGSPLSSRVTQDFPLEGSVVWSIYGAGGNLRPAPCPVLMNGLFVGLWKQAESLHPPPYGEAYRSAVARGHSEHLPLAANSEAPTGHYTCFWPPLCFHFQHLGFPTAKPNWHMIVLVLSVVAGWACLTLIGSVGCKQRKSTSLHFSLKLCFLLCVLLIRWNVLRARLKSL